MLTLMYVGEDRLFNISGLNSYMFTIILTEFIYSKTCLKQPLKYRQNKGLKDKW